MTLVLDTSTLKENLYVTNLKLSTPQKSINIDAKDLIDDEIAETWGTDGARVSFSLNISKRINEFIDRFTVARRNICGRLMFDGNNYLLFESSLNDFLIECKQLDDEFATALDEILVDWETVEDDFQFALSEKMRVALTKSFSSHNKTTIDEQIERVTEIYMTRKFPSAEVVRDKCGVIYDTPRLFKQAAPKGLSPEALAAYEKSQQENLKLIYDLLMKDYLTLELDVCIGFLDTIVTLSSSGTLPRLFHPSILEIAQDESVNESDEEIGGGEVFDLGIGEKKETSVEVEVASRLSELKNMGAATNGTRKYSINTYKKLLKSCKLIAENLNSSIPMLSKVIDPTPLEDMGVMLENTKTFYSWCESWVKEYETTGKKPKSFLAPTLNSLNDSDSNQEETKEVREVIDVGSILALEKEMTEIKLENNLIYLDDQEKKLELIEIDEDSDFDMAI